MSQELQNEEESSKGEMDKSLQEIARKGYDTGLYFEFERKRNRLERYDRNVFENYLKGIKTIDKVRTTRAESHIKKRLKPNKRRELEKERKELQQGISLVKAPLIQQEEPFLTLPKIKVKTSQPQEENVAMED